MKNLYIALFLCVFALVACEDDSDEIRGSYADISTSNADGDLVGNISTGDEYAKIVENPFIATADEPISTFSIDADGASYSNARRYLLAENQLPPVDAIRTEEMINYFDLDYVHQTWEHPISLNGEISACPWTEGNKLIRVGIQGKKLEKIPPTNFVFLIDVSGSMKSEDKLPMLKLGFNLLVDELTAEDRVAIVTYAGSDAVALESTSGSDKVKIRQAINKLGAGGSTAGAAGIVTAYEIAQQHFIEDGNNRVILGTDGDFNVGISNRDELVALIEDKRNAGVFLTVLGVGRGNLRDATLEQIANHGNGTYEYIDNKTCNSKKYLFTKRANSIR